MLHGKMTAGLQDIVKSNEIALDINVRMIDAVTHASLRRQVHHDIKLILLKQSIDRPLIRDIPLNKLIGYPLRFR